MMRNECAKCGGTSFSYGKYKKETCPLCYQRFADPIREANVKIAVMTARIAALETLLAIETRKNNRPQCRENKQEIKKPHKTL